jgi:hypothetical protein
MRQAEPKKYRDNSQMGLKWVGFVHNHQIIDISFNRSGGQAVVSSGFPCPGEAPSLVGVPPLHEIEASPGAPRFNDNNRIEYLRLQISNGTYLSDDILERTAERFLENERMEDDHDP